MTPVASPPRPERVSAPSRVPRARSGPIKRTQPYNGPAQPVWRCHHCNYWTERKIKRDPPACPWCRTTHHGREAGGAQVPMFATTRTEPVPSPALGSPFEDL